MCKPVKKTKDKETVKNNLTFFLSSLADQGMPTDILISPAVKQAMLSVSVTRFLAWRAQQAVVVRNGRLQEARVVNNGDIPFVDGCSSATMDLWNRFCFEVLMPESQSLMEDDEDDVINIEADATAEVAYNAEVAIEPK
jgi:hypothetical protein